MMSLTKLEKAVHGFGKEQNKETFSKSLLSHICTYCKHLCQLVLSLLLIMHTGYARISNNIVRMRVCVCVSIPFLDEHLNKRLDSVGEKMMIYKCVSNADNRFTSMAFHTFNFD